MKAPDKIYLGIGQMSGDEPNKRYLYAEWYENPEHYLVENIAYIRKDALLEWAKEKANDYKGTANIRRLFEMMIRKIESL